MKRKGVSPVGRGEDWAAAGCDVMGGVMFPNGSCLANNIKLINTFRNFSGTADKLRPRHEAAAALPLSLPQSGVKS
ncbi:hypothetical protein E2C01_030650 [Portunus trituberculatus]|uniref:Uncharacterized protein n=1 Tax=Portunus trituberculatus TaxID=210409 RepID=A0A5B7EVF1_PORTR|nr:hypothetical protein [Portunus trituberculatus]